MQEIYTNKIQEIIEQINPESKNIYVNPFAIEIGEAVNETLFRDAIFKFKVRCYTDGVNILMFQMPKKPLNCSYVKVYLTKIVNVKKTKVLLNEVLEKWKEEKQHYKYIQWDIVKEDVYIVENFLQACKFNKQIELLDETVDGQTLIKYIFNIEKYLTYHSIE